MIVYVDVLIFTNTIVNYCILSATQKFVHAKKHEWRLILGATVGALFSLSVFLETLNTLTSLVIKLVCSTTMCLISFGYNNIKLLIKSVISVFVFTVIFCSVMIAFYNLFNPKNMAIINDTVYFQIDSVLMIGLTIIIYIIIILIQKLLKSNLSNTIVNLNLRVNDNDVSCIGKIDTACTLTEPFSGAPVIIIEKSLLRDIKTERIIPYNSLGNSGIIYGTKAQKVVIDNKPIEKDVYIGIYESKLDPNFNAIINHNIIR